MQTTVIAVINAREVMRVVFYDQENEPNSDWFKSLLYAVEGIPPSKGIFGSVAASRWINNIRAQFPTARLIIERN